MKTALLYSLLVGVPFVGLMWILRVGEGLVPPRSIGGEWDLVLIGPPAAAATRGCTGLAFENRPPEFFISQSGTKGHLTFGDSGRTELSVSLEGDVIRGTGSGTAGDACLAGPATLEARLVGPPGEERIEGSVVRVGCDACPPARFVADRRSAARSEP